MFQLEQLQLGEILGEGAFGKVIKATNIQTGKKFAVKILHELSEQSKVRFLHEIQLLHALNLKSHSSSKVGGKYIVKIYGNLNINQPNYIMEYLEGGNLSNWLEDYKYALPQRKIVLQNIVIPLTHTLHFVHKLGVHHRDLKPENIMFKDRFHKKLRVVDWGLGKFDFAAMNLTRGGLGTPLYMAPEQYIIGGSSYKSDIFSLGIIMYYLLTKRLAVVYNDKLMPILYPPASSYHNTISKDLDNLIGEMLSVNPYKRPSAKSVRKRIEQLTDYNY